MITLNVNKELFKVEHWDDVLQRPGFTNNLDPTKHELGSIIGRYVFSDYVRCGLSDCHTPHGRGYLVATKDGRETNIGKDCGSKYFGVDFVEQARQFERDLEARDNREVLATAFFRLDELEARIETLRAGDHGARWIHRQVSALKNPAKIPTLITRTLEQMVRQRTRHLTASREANEKEIEQIEAMRGKKISRPYYLDEIVAEIQGLEALYQENDLRELLVVQLEEKIKEFKKVKIDDLQVKDLNRWSKWVQSIKPTLDTARDSVAFGRLLLTQSNLKPLLHKIDSADPRDEERLRGFLTTLPF
ncbi:hypothetical protein GJV26_18280 [Massilia dura]|uniref:Uncharacterized protein n=1 Tax=Pseudoduganella dura TaxID=321982 RepID=A0A6I3XMH5_9BURK|nr:hypothetical protein [Pseudoduganella dura]MUI14392.1 hypothetical protein [Pseudoduganella dura]GGY05583.1 hypothetical protein GCM10007386_40350 [Pseudoduganella dura]